jgi:hypothetical protein
MDEIFRNRGGFLVFNDFVLTQRERPQAFIDAERRRVRTATTAGSGEIYDSMRVSDGSP